MKSLDKLEIPLIQGGMGVGISMGNLAGSVALQGGMGVISTAFIGFRENDFYKNPLAASKRALKKEIEKAREISRGNGILAINAMVATTHFEEMVKTACECKIDAIISGAGLPLSLPKITQGFDVLLAPIVSSKKAASLLKKVWNKNYNKNPDFFVCEGSLAGGHLGFTNDEAMKNTRQDSINQLKEVVDEAKDIPVFSAGGIFNSNDIKETLEVGAWGVQLGSRFIACQECDASQGFKNVILKAKDEDVMVIKSPVGMPGRALHTPFMDKVSKNGRIPPKNCMNCIKTCNPKETPYCISKALIEAFYGNEEEGLFFCGTNAGKINEMTTVKELIEELAKGWNNK